jgi:lipopolysaccharide transport system ATP-binding protein
MSSNFAISARGVSKRYNLGEDVIGYRTVREELVRAIRHALGRVEGSGGRRQILWALEDVDFDVEQGTAVGIIGHNGAGKTTLLKILTRITPLTRGAVRLRGRVGSLLEVGSGMHPELTGRENIYLNGVLLGMRRSEIQRHFDEIASFAEIERFIDTPVKRYSSGMYVRLAFAVAAHLQPEILIVDEVLAVGDASFQRKCLRKMSEVAGEGRTVLLVSHNMTAIRSLTSAAMWLDHGRVAGFGATADVIASYLSSATAASANGLADLTADEVRRGAQKQTAREVEFESLSLQQADGTTTATVPELSALKFEIVFRAKRRVRFLEILVRVRTPEGTLVFASFSGQREEALERGRYSVVCSIDENILRPGRYIVELVAAGTRPQDIVPRALSFDVEPGYVAEENPRYAWEGQAGLVRVRSHWSDIERAAEVAPFHVDAL